MEPSVELGDEIGDCGVGRSASTREIQQDEAWCREVRVLGGAEARLRTLLAHAAATVVTINRDGRITSSNDTFKEGRPTDSVGRYYLDFLPEVVHAKCRDSFEFAFKAGQPAHCECRDSVGHWREAQFVPVIQDGQVTEVVATVHDVTARKEAEHQVRARLADIAHVHRVNTMGKLVAELAHEIAQPLYAITNYAQASTQLAHSHPEADKLVEWTQRISEEARRAGTIIRRVSQLVRKGQPERDEFDLHWLIAEVLDLVDPRTRRDHIEVTFSPAEGTIRVVAERVQIEQVILNLVQNAAEAIVAAETNWRCLHVETCRNVEDMVTVAIHDTGGGIAEEDLPSVFDPFFTTKPDGMGMGLAICRSIVEDHGGHLRASCNIDGGSTLSFTLPLSPEEPSHERSSDRFHRGR